MEREQLIRNVTAAQSGDNEALNNLFNAFYNDVYYFALKIVKDEDLACDITQETFVEIIQTIGALREPAAFVTWMKEITYHQCTRYFKKKKDVLVSEDEDGNTVFDTLAEDRAEFIPDVALDQEDFRKTILSMIDQLSDEQRAATMMFYFDELPVKQIAQMQGVSEGTVKSRLNYARKSIKASVEDYEKKNNIKLHSIGFLPLLLWLFRGSFQKAMPAAAAENVAAGVSGATGAAISLSAGSAAAIGAGTVAAVGLGAKLMALPMAVKLFAGVAAAALLVGGGLTAASHIAGNENEDAITEPEETVISTEHEATDPEQTEYKETQPEETEPTETQPEETDPVATDPVATEPAATEPEQTQPEETQPAATEPEATEPEATEPVATEPEQTQPVATEPEQTQPVATEPEQTQPEETQPPYTLPGFDFSDDLEETQPEQTAPPETSSGENEYVGDRV